MHDLNVFALGHAWVEQVSTWRRNAVRFVIRHLGDQTEELLPALTAPWSIIDEKHERTLEEVEPWLVEVERELVQLQDALGVSRNVSAVSPPGARFTELFESGLVDAK